MLKHNLHNGQKEWNYHECICSKWYSPIYILPLHHYPFFIKISKFWVEAGYKFSQISCLIKDLTGIKPFLLV